MNYDRSSLDAVVQHYFDAVYEGDADKLGAIFHPSADLRSLERGKLKVLTMHAWLDYFRNRPSAKAEGKPGCGCGPKETLTVTADSGCGSRWHV